MNPKQYNNQQMRSPKSASTNQMRNNQFQRSPLMMARGMNNMNVPGGPGSRNRNVINQNPMLGGTQYSNPGFAPSLPFLGAVKATPDHTPGRFVIPWDCKDHDYVYAACPNQVFRGKFTLQKLKQVSLFFLLPSPDIFITDFFRKNRCYFYFCLDF